MDKKRKNNQKKLSNGELWFGETNKNSDKTVYQKYYQAIRNRLAIDVDLFHKWRRLQGNKTEKTPTLRKWGSGLWRRSWWRNRRKNYKIDLKMYMKWKLSLSYLKELLKW